MFKLKNHQQIILPIGCILIFWSMVRASNFSEHIEEGIIHDRYISGFFHIIIPLLMLIVTLIRNRFKKKKIDRHQMKHNIIMLYSKAIGFKQIRGLFDYRVLKPRALHV
jgi:hypothetical protein